MAKFLTGTFCWFGRASVGTGSDRRTQLERGSFDHLKDQQVPIFLNHERCIGTGCIKILPWAASYEMELSDELAAEIEGLIRAGKIKGSSFSFTANDYATRYDANGYFYAVKKVASLHECGPSLNPAESWTTAEIIERATPVAASKPVAGKRTKQRMSVPPMPKSMQNGIAIMNAALAGKSVRIDGRTIDARTVAAVFSNVGPYAIH